MRYHNFQDGHYRKKKQKNKKKQTSVGEDMEKLEPMYTFSGDENGTVARENNIALPQTIKTITTICSSNSTSGYLAKRIEIKILKRN